ncbi:MAG: CPBP family intramembrane glutamic endopeptidase [Kofleriaceae bacterium]
MALIAFLPVGGVVIAMLLHPHLPAPDSHPYDGSVGTYVRLAVRAVFGGALLVAVGLLLVGRLRWRDVGWRDLSLRQVALGVMGFLGLFVVYLVFIVVVTDYSVGDFLRGIAGVSWREQLLGVLIGVNASLVEESLFRGYLQPLLCERLGTSSGVVVTAVLFSLVHIPTTVVAFAGRLLIGLCLGALRGQDRPLWAPAIAHTLVWIVIGAM